MVHFFRSGPGDENFSLEFKLLVHVLCRVGFLNQLKFRQLRYHYLEWPHFSPVVRSTMGSDQFCSSIDIFVIIYAFFMNFMLKIDAKQHVKVS